MLDWFYRFKNLEKNSALFLYPECVHLMKRGLTNFFAQSRLISRLKTSDVKKVNNHKMGWNTLWHCILIFWTCSFTGIYVQSNLVIRNILIMNKLVLRNHFPWQIFNLLHKNNEHLALRNNFRVTKKFLTTKFNCNTLYAAKGSFIY